LNKLSLEPGFLGKLVSDMQRDGGEIEARLVFLSRIGIEHDLVCRNHPSACAAASAFAARFFAVRPP